MLESNIESLPLVHRGKVRDIYAVDDAHLLFVATDRISAFDVVLPNPIPDKGIVLTRLSCFWFERFASRVPNHLTGIDPASVVSAAEAARIDGRALVVKRLRPIPIEAIVRGYLIGSGWKDYQASGRLCGISLPAGLRQAERLPQTLFTPSTKAAVGVHDENISFDRAAELVGEEVATQVRELSVGLYEAASAFALQRGIIIADTKFEFGRDEDGRIVLMDEVLTPDSSRFWALDEYRTGISPPSFDKQIIRDYLETCDWNKAPPAPTLPEAVVARAAARYQEVARRLMAN